MFSVLLALAAAPPPLTADQQRDLRCVALLAIVAGEQDRRTAAALALPPLARQGARYAQAVGDALVRTGRPQEQVRTMILAEVAGVQRQAGSGAPLPVEEARACLAPMAAAAPPLPPPGAVQCAATLRLVADQARREAPKAQNTLVVQTLAAALESRARAELRAGGQSEAESDRALGLAREALARNPDSAPDVEACMELARP